MLCFGALMTRPRLAAASAVLVSWGCAREIAFIRGAKFYKVGEFSLRKLGTHACAQKIRNLYRIGESNRVELSNVIA